MLALAMLLAVQFTPDQPELRYRQPQLATGDGMVALTFVAGRPAFSVHVAVSRDQGRSFTQPVKVAQPGFVSMGRHRGPRVAVADGAIVAAACVGLKPPASKMDLMAWRSSDGGVTWSPGVRINDAPGSTGEGFFGMTARGKLVLAVWLDVRRSGGNVYLSKSTDGGATWSANRQVYQSPEGHVCECCHPTVRIGAGGQVFLMWRNWLNGSRDMYLGTSTDGGETFRVEKLGQGAWPLNACPQDGGDLALDSRGNVVTVWRRADAVFLARPGQAEEELGKGTDPAVAVGPGDRIYAAWGTPEGLKLRVAGKPATGLGEHSGFVSFTVADSVIAAWENQGAVVVDRLP